MRERGRPCAAGSKSFDAAGMAAVALVDVLAHALGGVAGYRGPPCMRHAGGDWGASG